MKFISFPQLVTPVSASARAALVSGAALLILSACSQAEPPVDNAPAISGPALAQRAVRIGTEGPSLPACSSLSRVKDGGTDVFWAPDETRAVKARLPAGMAVSVCEASDDDQWFGIVFAAPRTDADMCGVTRAVTSAQEYQGPCRWGWIRGGSVRIGG